MMKPKLTSGLRRRGRPRNDDFDIMIHIDAIAKCTGRTINETLNRTRFKDIRQDQDGMRAYPVPTGTLKRRYYRSKERVRANDGSGARPTEADASRALCQHLELLRAAALKPGPLKR